MGNHIVNGEFQSDKYPTCPPGKVPLSVRDVTAQDLLWEYAQRRRAVDAEFAADLEEALTTAGYVHAIMPSSLRVGDRIEWGPTRLTGTVTGVTKDKTTVAPDSGKPAQWLYDATTVERDDRIRVLMRQQEAPKP